MDKGVNRRTPNSRYRPVSVLLRGAGFFLVWLALTEGQAHDAPAGLIAASLATWASIYLQPPASRPVSILALATFAARSMWASLIAGVDVARRALDPRLPIRPGIVAYPARLQRGFARDAFRTLMCLQPGSLPTESDEQDGFLIHCLDMADPVQRSFATEEQAFTAAIGIKHGRGQHG
jgi:multicomponent Na+:H+ antiporter subunit E